MESRTKNRKSGEILQRMVWKAFPEEHPMLAEVTELEEGFFNAAYLLKLENGRRLVVKIAPPPEQEVMSYERNIMKSEVEFLRLVRRETEVPVPEVYFYDNSRTLCDSDFFFMEFLKGMSLAALKYGNSLNQRELEGLEEEIGRLNHSMNQIRGERFGLPGCPATHSGSWRESFCRLAGLALEDGKRKDCDIGTEYEQVEDTLRRHAAVLDEITEPYLVHNDLWDGNIFISGGRITGIIDFERSLWGDPVMEFSMKDGMAGPTAFLRGYGALPLEGSRKKRRLLYNLYLFLIMTVECTYRHYDSEDQYRWAKGRLLDTLRTLG